MTLSLANCPSPSSARFGGLSLPLNLACFTPLPVPEKPTSSGSRTRQAFVTQLTIKSLKQKAPSAPVPTARAATKKIAPPLTVPETNPMRAAAADTLRKLHQMLESLAPGWSAGARSGDTAPAEWRAQNAPLLTALVTMRESRSALLLHGDCPPTKPPTAVAQEPEQMPCPD